MRKLSYLKNNKGFSLVELVVVITIMVILIAVFAPNIVGYVRKSHIRTMTMSCKTIYVGAQAYVSEKKSRRESIDTDTIAVEELWNNQYIQPIEGDYDIEIKLSDNHLAVDYVYYDDGSGVKADYPYGASGKEITAEE